MYLAGDTELP